MTPDWQLPPGADRGLWDYVSAPGVAAEYDHALGGSPLLSVDTAFARVWLVPPGRLVDLGCGTGRLLVEFATAGYECVGVDLSEPMLEAARAKADAAGVRVELVRANLVELGDLGPATFNHAACLFSTLGMIRGSTHRAAFLGHVRRILKPGGRFVVHAHNREFRLGWGLGRRGTEPGDRTMPQIRGGAPLTLHHYTRAELLAGLTGAGFRILGVELVASGPTAGLRKPWLLPRWRAHGFLVACEAT